MRSLALLMISACWAVPALAQERPPRPALYQPPPPLPSPFACLTAQPPPTSALITYGGQIQPATVPIALILPQCIRLSYGGNPLWTTVNAAGGISCVGSSVQVDYTAANSAFNGVMLQNYIPAACGPAQPAPNGPPPAASGSSVNIYHGPTIDMSTVPLLDTAGDCYHVDYGGSHMWFPTSALGYRTDFVGNPVGLDYTARRSTPCGVAPPPIPPVAPPTAPASVCLSAQPPPTTALITYGGQAQPATVGLDVILPKCIRLNYGGNPLWTTADAAGGVSCVGSMVQVDYSTANDAFNGVWSTSPPAACQ